MKPRLSKAELRRKEKYDKRARDIAELKQGMRVLDNFRERKWPNRKA
jgi:hypothetical protein